MRNGMDHGKLHLEGTVRDGATTAIQATAGIPEQQPAELARTQHATTTALGTEQLATTSTLTGRGDSRNKIR